MTLREIFDDLTRFDTELRNGLDARLRAAHDLPLVRFEAMRIIDSTSPCRVFDISETLVMTSGAASKVVDRIEASGYVRRKVNPTDARSTVVELTAAGKRVLARAGKTFDTELRARLDASGRALDQLGATLRKLRVSSD